MGFTVKHYHTYETNQQNQVTSHEPPEQASSP